MSSMNTHHWIEEALLVPQKPVEIPELKIPENGILVERTYYKKGTHGVLTFPDGTKLFTLERPWLNNERRISCIPEGVYKLSLHQSPLVTRLTGGDYTWAWELQNVKDRSYILVHQGNYVRNSAGCILVGMSQSFQGQEPVVWESRKAFDLFMNKMKKRTDWQMRLKEK